MTGLAGYYLRDGTPADAGTLECISLAVAHRAADGISYSIVGPCGLASFGASVHSESLPELAMAPASRTTITFHGRIDNRQALTDTLALRPEADDALTDAELVLRAYLAWGTESASRLLGDFAYALWDPSAARLYCARDFSATVPFYYYLSSRVFVWGTEIRQVLAHPAVPHVPNEGMIGEYLIWTFENRAETLYQGVMRLPPAHQLVVSGRNLRLTRFWDFVPSQSVSYRHPDQYQDYFHDIFRAAVASRLRGVPSPAVTLSGGLDSSSVAGMAATLLREEQAGRTLTAYSVVFPGLDTDETPYIDAVSAKWALTSKRFPWSVLIQPPDWLSQSKETRDIPDYPNLAMSAPLLVSAATAGTRVLLTGEGGDNWLTGTRYPFLGLLSRRQLSRAAQEFRFQATYLGQRFAVTSLLRDLLWYYAPARLRGLAERSHTRSIDNRMLNPEFLHGIKLRDRIHCNDCGERFRSLPHWDLYRQATAGQVAHYAEIVDRFDARFGVQRRHPLQDRRIAEFAMGVPDDVHQSLGRSKLLLRDAMPSILPELVGNRMNRGEFSVVVVHALRSRQVARILASDAANGRAWIVRGTLMPQLDRAIADWTNARPGAHSRLRNCWMAFAIEVWFRAAFET